MSTSVLDELRGYRQKGAFVNGRRLSPSELLSELRRFGARVASKYDDFRSPEQELVVYRALEDHDVLAVMPTGSGKSLTYQFTSFLRPQELTLVVSPLRALIKQQDDFLPFGIGLTGDTVDREEVWRSLLRGDDHVLFVSPEMLSGHVFQSRLVRYLRKGHLRLGRFVVDEVHCLSDWGHDFRPHYWWVAHHLRQLESAIPAATKTAAHVPRLLLTATADERVTGDIRDHFPEIEAHEIIRAAVRRPELILAAKEVRSTSERIRLLDRFLRRQAKRELPKGTARRGIVFTLEAVSHDDDNDELKRRKKADRLKANHIAQLLKAKGHSEVHTFSAKGMNKVERELALEAFAEASPRKGQVTAIVATNAFGMGMDFSGVPFVCHVYPRTNVSEYWQQAGRAGRGLTDGHCAETLALYSRDDNRYAARFAKAPALDGLINSFTMPLHGWMYVWNEGGGHMSMAGSAGGRTAFSRLLPALQDLGVIDRKAVAVAAPANAVRYRVNLRALKRKSIRAALDQLQTDRFSSKRLRKVFRYLRIAARSKQRRFILLDRWLYDEDRQGSVLQRLNRWVDAGCLRLNRKPGPEGEIRLDAVNRKLSNDMIRTIDQRAEDWAEHKRQALDQMMRVLRAQSPITRQRRVLSYFREEHPEPFAQPAAKALPVWMRRR